jgi:hypothetical protein
MKFPAFNVTRRFAAEPPAPAKSQLSPVHILALLFVSVLSSHSCVIFQVYISLYISHPSMCDTFTAHPSLFDE